MSDNVSKLQQLYAAFGRGEIQTILESVTEDVEWGAEAADSNVPWHRTRHGREEVADFFATLDREVEFTQFEPTLFAGAADQVLVHLNIGFNVKKNGNGAAFGAIHQFIFDGDGKVTKFRAYEDTAVVRNAWN